MAGSFWAAFGTYRNGGQNGIDELLARDNCTLSDLLNHEQLITECKYMNPNLTDVLSEPNVVSQLIRYVIASPPEKSKPIHPTASTTNTDDTDHTDGDKSNSTQSDTSTSSKEGNSSDDSDDDDTNTTKYLNSDKTDNDDPEMKYPYIASELFACEIPTMLNALFLTHLPQVDEELDKLEQQQQSQSHSQSQSQPASPQSSASSSTQSSQSSTESSQSTSEETSSNNTASTTEDSSSTTASSTSTTSSTTTASSPDNSSETSSTTITRKEPHYPLLRLLLSFLDRPAPIDPSLASYFRKVMVVLIQRKYSELVKYLVAHNVLDKLIKHIYLYSVMEILIMLGWDDGLGNNQDIGWLVESNLVGKLINNLSSSVAETSPDTLIHSSRALVDVIVKCSTLTSNLLIKQLDETHNLQRILQLIFESDVTITSLIQKEKEKENSIAEFKEETLENGEKYTTMTVSPISSLLPSFKPTSMLSLTNGLSIIIVLVQRYANILEQKKQLDAQQRKEQENDSDEDEHDKDETNSKKAKSEEEKKNDATFDLATCATSSLPPVTLPSVPTAQLPEPFFSILPYIPSIFNLFDVAPVSSSAPTEWSYGRGESFGETRLKIAELVLVLLRSQIVQVERIIIEQKTLPKLLQLFFKFPWNNILHGLVESLVRSLVLEPLRDLELNGNSANAATGTNLTTPIILNPTPLLISLFHDGKLAEVFQTAIEEDLKTLETRGLGSRKGNIAHLFAMCASIEEVFKKLETLALENVQPLTPSMRERWLGSADAVKRWSFIVDHFITPEIEKQKYDTLAFLQSSEHHDEDDDVLQFDSFNEAAAALGIHSDALTGDLMAAITGSASGLQITENNYDFDPDGDSMGYNYNDPDGDVDVDHDHPDNHHNVHHGEHEHDYGHGHDEQAQNSDDWADFSGFSSAPSGESPNRPANADPFGDNAGQTVASVNTKHSSLSSSSHDDFAHRLNESSAEHQDEANNPFDNHQNIPPLAVPGITDDPFADDFNPAFPPPASS